MFSTSVKPFDLSEATKLSLVLSASQHINQQQLKDSFMKNFNRYSTSDFDDNDSRFSFSSSSSPVHVIEMCATWAYKLKSFFLLEWKQRPRLDRHNIRILRERLGRDSQVAGNQSVGRSGHLVVGRSHNRCRQSSFGLESNLFRHHHDQAGSRLARHLIEIFSKS